MRRWPALRLTGLAARPSAPAPAVSPTSLESIDETPGSADLVLLALADCDVAAIEERSDDEWQVCFGDDDARAQALAQLARVCPGVGAEPFDLDDGDWAARSQASLRAVRVGGLLIAPPWDVPAGVTAGQTHDGARVIVILPSMGFGTGHHATTRLCLAALQQVPLDGARVIDVGTGSGVLAIAASLLGAREVVGLDDDPDAVAAARENLDFNPQASVSLSVQDLRTLQETPFDLVTANLTGGLLIAAAPGLLALVRPGGRLILSGLMDHEADDVLRAFSACDVTARAQEDEWICATLQRR